MCILSIYSNRNGDFILTQNRDENIFRPTSDSVETREIYDVKFTGPVDLTSGGTWIYHTEKYVVCVLNGAYQNHKHQPPYRMSRGLVILELLKSDSPQSFIESVELNEIEPFTMVIIDIKSSQKLILVWDGKEKFVEDVSNQKLITRSSSTLYSTKDKKEHQSKFENLTEISPQSIFELHERVKMTENKSFKTIQTTSITQVISKNSTVKLHFCQLIDAKST